MIEGYLPLSHQRTLKLLKLNIMKQLFFFFVVLTTFACQKQEVDCDKMTSHCQYILTSFSTCIPVKESGKWVFEEIRRDTITDALTQGCPDQIETEWLQMQENIINLPTTNGITRQFLIEFPSSCDCK